MPAANGFKPIDLAELDKKLPTLATELSPCLANTPILLKKLRELPALLNND